MNKKVKRLIWFNGEIIPSDEAKINLMTTTAQYGINVFEGIRCYSGTKNDQLYSFRLAEHIKRLFDSAKLIKFELNSFVDEEYVINNMRKIIKANNYSEDIYVKIGLYLDGEGSWSSTGPIGLFILPSPKSRVYSDKVGLRCCISSWQRINESSIPPRIKSGANYINSRYGLLEASMNGYDSAIFLNKSGTVAEGPGACIFIVKEGKLITPPITASILDSITRKSIIQIASSELGIEVEEREIDRTELYIADEIFFAGTAVEILPILSVDNYIVGDKVGEITNKLKTLYFNIVRGEMPQYHFWINNVLK